MHEARIACSLWSKQGVACYDKEFDKKAHPYFTQTGNDRIVVEVGGHGKGKLEVSHQLDFAEKCAVIHVAVDGKVAKIHTDFKPDQGTQQMYFPYVGDGAIEFHSLELL